ncbi:hypothetical protein NP493_456g00007 [Ridgeia piscesae]|uniref:Uncharacterized protein n=1 Tax=Ridgeia piscesae TaxID=27915 RepID=A0AAD9KZA2_RIDPI|nr:hypothetical protein NP493_456g00007 [Ridgeia piscesae]
MAEGRTSVQPDQVDGEQGPSNYDSVDREEDGRGFCRRSGNRKRLNILTTVADEQKREQTSIELDADVVRDEEDYEPTAAAENENEYERTTPVPVRDDYVNVNVYDMIKN